MPIFSRACVPVTITVMVVKIDHILWGGRTSTPRQGDDRATYRLNDGAPMRQCISRGSLWKREYHKMKYLIEGCHPSTKLPVRIGPNNLGRMRLTLHTTHRAHQGASRLVIECDPGRAKTRHAWSRLLWGCEVNCRMTMACKDYGYTD